MADITVDTSVRTTLGRNVGSETLVWISPTTGYLFYLEDNSKPNYYKTTNSGVTWVGPTVIDATNSAAMITVWYDRWTKDDTTGTLIHIGTLSYTPSPDAALYYQLDTSDDSLSGPVTVFTMTGDNYNNSSFLTHNASIIRTQGGNLLFTAVMDDSPHESFCYRSTDVGTNWTARTSPYEAGGAGAQDMVILCDWNSGADTNDAICLYDDVSANQLSLKVYDDSGNTWTEVTILANGHTEQSAIRSIAIAHRHSDGWIWVAYHTSPDTATDDIKVSVFKNNTTEVVVSDVKTDIAESGVVSLFINQQNGYVYCAYLYGTAFYSDVSVYYKYTDDNGATWETEAQLDETGEDDYRVVSSGYSVGDDGGRFQPWWFNIDLYDILTNAVNAVSIPVAAVGSAQFGGGLGGILVGKPKTI